MLEVSEVVTKTTVTTFVGVNFTEAEAAGLDELTSYGDEAILNALEKMVSSALVRDHCVALSAAFDRIRSLVRPHLGRVREYRRMLLHLERCPLPPPEGFEWELGGWMGPTLQAPWPKLKVRPSMHGTEEA